MEMYCLIVRSWKSEIKMSSRLVSFEASPIWLVDGRFLPVSSHGLPSVCVPVSLFPALIGTPTYWIREHPNDPFLT